LFRGGGTILHHFLMFILLRDEISRPFFHGIFVSTRFILHGYHLANAESDRFHPLFLSIVTSLGMFAQILGEVFPFCPANVYFVNDWQHTYNIGMSLVCYTIVLPLH